MPSAYILAEFAFATKDKTQAVKYAIFEISCELRKSSLSWRLLRTSR